MSKEIEEIIQEDIDIICIHGHYSVSRAYTTLISARDKIKELQKELNFYKDIYEIKESKAECLGFENTKLKEENNRLFKMDAEKLKHITKLKEQLNKITNP